MKKLTKKEYSPVMRELIAYLKRIGIYTTNHYKNNSRAFNRRPTTIVIDTMREKLTPAMYYVADCIVFEKHERMVTQLLIQMQQGKELANELK